MERSAFDRWIKADPDGYLGLSATDATCFYPVVRVDGDIAVLTFNLVNYGKPIGSTEEAVLARWNAAEVYGRIDGEWRIIHTHWSFTQLRLAPPDS